MKTLTLEKLNTKEAMLETLQNAYRYVLDENRDPFGNREPENSPSRRLNVADQKELGRRLAIYWGTEPKLKCEPYNPPVPEMIKTLRDLITEQQREIER